MPRGCLRFVIVVFPDHTHLLFLYYGLWKASYNAIQKDEISPRLRGGGNNHKRTKQCLMKVTHTFLKTSFSPFQVGLKYIRVASLRYFAKLIFRLFSWLYFFYFLSSFRPMFLLGEMTNGHKQAIVY